MFAFYLALHYNLSKAILKSRIMWQKYSTFQRFYENPTANVRRASNPNAAKTVGALLRTTPFIGFSFNFGCLS